MQVIGFLFSVAFEQSAQSVEIYTCDEDNQGGCFSQVVGGLPVVSTVGKAVASSADEADLSFLGSWQHKMPQSCHFDWFAKDNAGQVTIALFLHLSKHYLIFTISNLLIYSLYSHCRITDHDALSPSP